jgi:predicted phage tail protein
MFRVIKVYGKLAKHLGQRSFKAVVSTPAEAVRFLLANFPELRALMREGQYMVSVGRSPLELGTNPELLHYPSASFETIRIVPVVAGAGAAGRIILGAVLIGVAIFSGGIGFGASVFFATAGQAASFGTALVAGAGNLGIALVLGGVAQLLTPTPKVGVSESDPRRSYSFSGIQNVSRQGVPVPVIYGEVFTGSVVISAGINTEEVAT